MGEEGEEIGNGSEGKEGEGFESGKDEGVES